MTYPESWLCKTIELAAGCKAYSWSVPRNAAAPLALILPPEVEPLESLEGDEYQPVASHVIEVYAKHQVEAKELWRKIKHAINNFSGVFDGLTITSTWIDSETAGELEYTPGEDMPAAYLVQGTIHIRYLED